MAVDESRIITDDTYFITAADQIIADRDMANDELNAFLDPLVTELGGDPNHLKFATKKVNYILENENEWAAANTLGAVKFNYEKRLTTVRDLAKQAEFQIKTREKTLKLNDELIGQLAVELQTIRERNIQIKQENAAIEAKIDTYEESVKSVDDEIKSLQDSVANSPNRGQAALTKTITDTIARKTNMLNTLAELKGTLESNKLKLVPDADISARQTRLQNYQQKQIEAYTRAQEQKNRLVNEFKKDKIELNLTDTADAQEKTEETPGSNGKEEKVQQGKGGGAGGGAVAPTATIPTTAGRTTEQVVKDMYSRLNETGKVSAADRKFILSGMGYSDLTDMASKMSLWKRFNVNRLLNATLDDIGSLDNTNAVALDNLLLDKFGVADAYSTLAEGDFSKLSKEQLSDIKSILDKFNKNPDNYTRDEQILIDEFAKRVSLKSLSYQMMRSGVFGRLVEYFTPGRQGRKDILSSCNTLSEKKSERIKTVANSDFAIEMKANVKSNSEISMSPYSSLENKQQQYDRGMRR